MFDEDEGGLDEMLVMLEICGDEVKEYGVRGVCCIVRDVRICGDGMGCFVSRILGRGIVIVSSCMCKLSTVSLTSMNLSTSQLSILQTLTPKLHQYP